MVAAYHAAFDLMRFQSHPLNYLSIGAMGLVSFHALGLALGRPERQVIVLDSVGSLVMNLGSLVTIAEAAPKNLIHFVCENGTYEANGGYPIPGQGKISFAGFAKAASIEWVYELSDLTTFESDIAGLLRTEGPVFATLKVEPGVPSPLDWDFIHGPKTSADFKAAITQR